MGKIHIHEVGVSMTEDRQAIEDFLNSLRGEIISIIPNINTDWAFKHTGIDFLWVVEREKE